MLMPPRFGDRRRMRIGLLGGSFNPAHPGHRHIARVALARLRLDQVWLLVSPGNPLKHADGMAPLAARLASARAIAGGRILATDIERHLHTRFTVDTLRALRRLFPCARFVWLMGADNLRQFPRWRGWLDIAATMPFAVLPRPGYNEAALFGQAAQRLAPSRLPARMAPVLADQAPPAWLFLPARQDASSATALRAGAAASTPQHHQSRTTTIARKPPTESASKLARGATGDGTARRTTRTTATLAEAAKTAGTPRKKAAAAGPRARGKREAPVETSRLDQIQAVIVESLESDKAEGVVALDLAGRASFADRMVIATGLADRQISAMATHIEEKLEEIGIRRIQIEGLGGSDWVLIDTGDIVVHLFKPEARSLYALEKMWGPELDEPRAEPAGPSDPG